MTTTDKILHITRAALLCKRHHIHVSYAPHTNGLYVEIHRSDHDYSVAGRKPEPPLYNATVYLDVDYGDDIDAVMDTVDAYLSVDEVYGELMA